MIRRPLVLSLLILAVVLACALLFCAQIGGLPGLAYFYISSDAGKQMAYDLVQPYPNSRLISSESERQANSGTKRRKYQTPDNIDSVLTFIRQQFPDQTIYEHEGMYSLSVIDHSWLSNLALPIARNDAYLPDFTDLPQAGITIYQSTESGNGTVIEIGFYWPLW